MDAHTSLTARGADLLDAARAATSKRAAATIFNSPILKAVLLGLAEGGALAEHNGPPAATLQCLKGTARLYAGDTEWVLHAGDIAAVPQERHGVDAITDCIVLLTVAAGQAPAPVEATLA
ncbi:MAG TPA: LuxR family transcriptional regulator [Dermatophilaceae bacterium]|jgi:quercetin dioxygenase-like cupin family protein|nr:LuxR family transcriptional regulator [Dermatophilaceae bacterium]